MLKRLAIGIVVKILDPKIPRVGGGGALCQFKG